MTDWFDPIRNLLDVDYLQNNVRLLVLGMGRVARAFILMAAFHGVRSIVAVDPDWVTRRNFASGFPERSMGIPKVWDMQTELQQISSRISYRSHQMTLSPGSETAKAVEDWVEGSTHLGLFLDTFGTASSLVQIIHRHRPCVFAGVLQNGTTGESAFSVPGQTPCLNCTARFWEKRGAEGGQTMLVDVISTVTVAFRQFMGLCLVERRGFDLFAPYVNPRFCLAVTINRPGGYVELADGRPDIPSGVKLVQVVDGNGGGPSCPVCRGYRP